MRTIYSSLLLLVTTGLPWLLVPALAQDPPPYHVTPPAPYSVPVVQPDGTTLHLIARGTPNQHWSETTDGYTVVKGANGYYEYATRQQNRLVGTGQFAQDPQQRSLSAQRQLLSVPKHEQPEPDAQWLRQQLSPFRNARTQAQQAAVPTQGKVRILAICIDYPDLPSTLTTDDFFNMLNGPSAQPSFREYFLENSYGKLDMSVDVVGWVQAKKNFRHYGNSGGFSASHELVAEAIDGAENRGVDFSKYDNNDDGNVDGVIIIHSGPGAEEGGRNEYVWSHRWAINSRFYDGRNVGDYTIQPETRYGGPVGIGIFCHEFGHLLGLPDLYDTEPSDGKSNGIGEWGLMGYGGWLGDEAYPAGLSAWSKEKLGWANVRDITGEHAAYELKAAGQYNDFYKIRTPNSDEYFLLENRQRRGGDRQLNSSGLAIWHIDTDLTSWYPTHNRVNGDASHKGVDLEEADGRGDLDNRANYGDTGDLFPGNGKKRLFDDTTQPNSDIYATINGSKASGVRIENIREVDGKVSFVYQSGDAGAGWNCDNPIAATVGKNQSELASAWYEFTMPRSGGISLRYEWDDVSQVEVYTECDGQPLAKSTTANLTVGYLQQNQKVLIRWEFANNPVLPLSWNLRVENTVNPDDSLALVAIYQKTGGPSWSKRTNWLAGPVTSWEGVRVTNGRVTELTLEEAGLTGSVPAEIYQLTALRKLNLREANLNGKVGNEITRLTELEQIFLEGPLTADFLEQVDQLKELKKLILLSVAVNRDLPSAIGNLKRLEELVIIKGELGGSIPETISSCRALTRVDLSGNRLRGKVPAGLFDLPNLASLTLHTNQLESLPANVLASGTLRACYLQNNQLQGGLPRDVGRSSSAPLTLALGANRLTGSVPESWTRITFDELALNDNQLTGELPPIKMPVRLDISNNEFSGLPALERSSFLPNETGELICHSNRLTFEDLVPNRAYLSCPNCQGRYAPQADVRINLDRNLKPGETTTVELPLDDRVSGSRYVWYQQDQEVARTSDNKLAVSEFGAQQAGVYRTTITNEALPGLTIRVVGISLNLQEKQTQTISVPSIADKQFGDDPFTIDARSSADLPLEYQKVNGPIAMEGNRVTIQGAGPAKIRVVSNGNDVYGAMEQEISFTIAKATPVIRAQPVSDKQFGDQPFQLAIEVTDNLPVNLTVEEGNVSLDSRWVRIQGAGPVRIRASREAGADYEAAEPVVITFAVNRAPQSLAFATVPDTTYVPDGKIALPIDLSSNLDVAFEVLSGGVDIEDGYAMMKQAGPVRIRATQPGNDNYASATPAEQSFVIEQATQQIYFERIDDKMTTAEPFALEASSSADQPVSFRIIRGSASVNNQGILSIDGEGEVVVEAFQEGNVNYQAAAPVTRSFLVQAANKQNQTITVIGVPDTVLVGESVALNVAVSSDLPPEIQVTGPATVSDRTVSFTQVGEVALQISQPGNDIYNAAATLERTVIVIPRGPTTRPLTQNLVYGPDDREYGDSVLVQSSSGLSLSLEVVEGPAVITESGLVRMTGLGEVQVKATQPKTDRYAAIDTMITFTVSPAAQVIEFEATELSDSTYQLQATVDSGLPITYSVEEGDAVIKDDVLTIRAEDSVVVVATQAGDAFYLAAVPQRRVFNVLTVTGVEEPAVLQIYPNPSSAVFRVDLAPRVKDAAYWVFNTQGQQVQRGTLRLSDTTLDLGQVATGTYVLHLRTDQGISQHRLVKE